MKKVIPYIEIKKIEDKSNMVGKVYYKAEYKCSFNQNGTTNIEDMIPIFATSDISREIVLTEFSASINYATGYDENIFANAKENVCVVSKEMLEKNGWELGKTINIYAPNETIMEENIAEFLLVGVYEPTTTSSNDSYNLPQYKNAVYCAVDPFATTAKTFYFSEKERWGHEFVLSEAEYFLKDSRDVEKFKNYIKTYTSFYSESPSNELISRITLMIYDDELKGMIGPVQSITSFMEKALPAIFLIIGTIAFGISYLMTQNRITDIALMRAMGVKTMKIYNIIMNEMNILCLIGIAVGLLICLIIYPKLFITLPSIGVMALVIIMYLLTFVVGSTIALSLILKLKPITVLTKKE